MVYGNITGKYAERTESGDTENKVYFQVDNQLWKNYKQITVYVYEHDGDALFSWGSRIGYMTNEGNDIWSFDFAEKDMLLTRTSSMA